MHILISISDLCQPSIEGNKSEKRGCAKKLKDTSVQPKQVL